MKPFIIFEMIRVVGDPAQHGRNGDWENKMSKGQKVGIRVVSTNKYYICISFMFFFSIQLKGNTVYL